MHGGMSITILAFKAHGEWPASSVGAASWTSSARLLTKKKTETRQPGDSGDDTRYGAGTAEDVWGRMAVGRRR